MFRKKENKKILGNLKKQKYEERWREEKEDTVKPLIFALCYIDTFMYKE